VASFAYVADEDEEKKKEGDAAAAPGAPALGPEAGGQRAARRARRARRGGAEPPGWAGRPGVLGGAAAQGAATRTRLRRPLWDMGKGRRTAEAGRAPPPRLLPPSAPATLCPSPPSCPATLWPCHPTAPAALCPCHPLFPPPSVPGTLCPWHSLPLPPSAPAVCVPLCSWWPFAGGVLRAWPPGWVQGRKLLEAEDGAGEEGAAEGGLADAESAESGGGWREEEDDGDGRRRLRGVPRGQAAPEAGRQEGGSRGRVGGPCRVRPRPPMEGVGNALRVLRFQQAPAQPLLPPLHAAVRRTCLAAVVWPLTLRLSSRDLRGTNHANACQPLHAALGAGCLVGRLGMMTACCLGLTLCTGPMRARLCALAPCVLDSVHWPHACLTLCTGPMRA